MNTKPADLYQLTRMYYVLYFIKYPEVIVYKKNRKKQKQKKKS